MFTLQIKGKLNTPTFYDRDKTKGKPLDHGLSSAIVSERRNCIILKEEAVSHTNVLLNAFRLMYWNIIQDLMENFQLEQTSGQWMLFIASWKFSLKAAVLLHNGNKVTFVPLFQAIHMRERHECLQVFLPKIRYYEHLGNKRDDLNVIAMTTVYPKFCCL